MASDPSIAALQTAINRYTVAVPAIGVDGILGAKTADALIKALAWLSNNRPSTADTARGLITRLVTDQGAFNLPQIEQSAPGLTIYLNDRGDEAGLPKASEGIMVAVAKPPAIQTTKSTTPPDLVLALKRKSFAASAADALNRLPKWASYAGGAVLAFGAIFMVLSTASKRGRKAPSPARALPPPTPARAKRDKWTKAAAMSGWRY